MFNLFLAIMLTAFPTPEQVRVDIARADSLRVAHYQQLLAGEIKPDIATKLALNNIRGDIGRDFKTGSESYGRVYIRMGNVKGTGTDRAEFIETVLRKELDESGWRLKKWDCDLVSSSYIYQGWVYQWWIVPKEATND